MQPPFSSLLLLATIFALPACSDGAESADPGSPRPDATPSDGASDAPSDAGVDAADGFVDGDWPDVSGDAPDALGDGPAVVDVVVEATVDVAVEAPVVEPFRVYVSTAGSDTNDGLTPSASVLTLTRVHGILGGARPDRDVEVRIAQGTYTGQSVTWSYYHPDHEISFMPVDYQGGGIGSIAGRPVFDGQGAGALLTLNASEGRETNLSFIYLQVQGYRTYGLLFRGDRNDFDHGWNGGNRVYGCLLTKVGNLANAGDAGYGALDLVNSHGNEIRNNHFVNVENVSSSAGLMHAVYLAHGSSDNEIRANRFVGISGDPIRVRDGSNRNQVTDNTFEKAGSVAFISDWWCDKSANPNCTKPGGECPSWENAFRDNDMHCGYGGAGIATFHYFQGETNVPSWCVNHAATDGWARVRTSGNTKSCP
jgi:hypothetical protein